LGQFLDHGTLGNWQPFLRSVPEVRFWEVATQRIYDILLRK